MLQKNFDSNRAKQKGSTLIVSMMLLILIMMMGVTAMVSSDTQFKLAGNIQFEDAAINNAEAGINAAESQLLDLAYSASVGFTTYSSATPERYPITAVVDPLTMAWSDTNSQMVGDDSKRFIVQLVSKNVSLTTSGVGVGGRTSALPSVVNTYLITARGTSARGSTKYLQSYFKVNPKS
jgi:Tfp pilus assembly protein PilX